MAEAVLLMNEVRVRQDWRLDLECCCQLSRSFYFHSLRSGGQVQRCWVLRVRSNSGSCKPGCCGLCLCSDCLSDLSFVAAITVPLVLLILKRVELGSLRCFVGLICLNLTLVL